MRHPPVPTFLRGLHLFATRIGHDAVWLLIAGLFCIVEGIIFVTDLAPHLFRHNRENGADVPDTDVDSETAPTKA